MGPPELGDSVSALTNNLTSAKKQKLRASLAVLLYEEGPAVKTLSGW